MYVGVSRGGCHVGKFSVVSLGEHRGIELSVVPATGADSPKKLVPEK